MSKNNHAGDALLAIGLGLLGAAAIGTLIAALTKPKCPSCRRPIDRGAIACPHCGTLLDWGDS